MYLIWLNRVVKPVPTSRLCPDRQDVCPLLTPKSCASACHSTHAPAQTGATRRSWRRGLIPIQGFETIRTLVGEATKSIRSKMDTHAINPPDYVWTL